MQMLFLGRGIACLNKSRKPKAKSDSGVAAGRMVCGYHKANLFAIFGIELLLKQDCCSTLSHPVFHGGQKSRR